MNLLKTLIVITFSIFIAKYSFSQTTIITYSLEIPISAGENDVEERADGSMYINSTDLELTNDGNQQTIGLHFTDIDLPQGATILSAAIQFTTDETTTQTTNLQISAELNENASAFSTTNFNVSNRIQTQNQIEWAVPSWTSINTTGTEQQTPDLSAVIQEIVNQSNWVSGNALNMIIEGTGKRVAHAFEGNANLVARLEIEAELEVFEGDLSGIFINELMAINEVVLDNFGETDDWLELYNSNDFAVILEGLFISDDAADLMKWQIDVPLFIPANDFTVFWLDDAPEQGGNHVPFKLSSAGETIFISQIQGGELSILDSISYPNLEENISFGRKTDGNNQWVFFGEYSPKESNNGKGEFLDVEVEIFPKSGVFPADLTIEITADAPDVDIRYTTDGSLPTATSTLYTGGPIFLEEPTIVQAAAFKTGFLSTNPVNEFFLIGNDHDLPIVQLTFEPDHFFDDQEGIYIAGNNGIPGFCSNAESYNWNQDWERPVKVRYLTPNGEVAFVEDGSVKIGGGCSRGFQQKGLNFFFKDGRKIEYPLFENIDIDEYKRFKLRASGNDFIKTFIRDGTIHSMLYNQFDIDLMAYQPVVAYLNGEYWGIYGMREFFNKHHLEAHHDVDKDSIDLLKNPYSYPEIKEGNTVAWDELTDYITVTSLISNQAYNWVTQRVDENEFINYHAVQIYTTNYDWPANNVTVWRDRNGGKFRWMLFDTDLSSGYGDWLPAGVDYDAIGHATDAFGAPWPNGPASTLLIRRMFQNDGFREEFSQRICTIGQTIFAPERAEFFIDSLKNKIIPEIPAILNKWNDAPSELQFWNGNPLGGTANNWLASINDFKNFFNLRFPFMMDNFESRFSYSGHFNLAINYDENTDGTVVFHKNEMSIPFHYSGDYFENIPIRIKAIPKDGYHFVRWEETGVTDATIDFVTNSDSELTPIFAEGTTPTTDILATNLFIHSFPNPAKEQVTIQFQSPKKQAAELRITDILGKVLFSDWIEISENQKQISVNLADWKTGVYSLEIISERAYQAQQFVKQ